MIGTQAASALLPRCAQLSSLLMLLFTLRTAVMHAKMQCGSKAFLKYLLILVMQAGPKFTKLLQEALKLVSGCECAEVTGCPGCIQFMRCDAYNTILHKQGAMIVLGVTLEQELRGNNGNNDEDSRQPCAKAQKAEQQAS